MVHEGRDTLAFDYDLGSEKPSFMGLETKHGVPGLARLRFKIKADHTTFLFVGLTEPKPGLGRNVFVTVRKGVWEQIDLKLSDFGHGDNPRDPLDVGPPLDLDRVQGFGITDAGGYALREPKNLTQMFNIEVPSGEHTLLMQDFEALKGKNDTQPEVGTVHIDQFDRGMLQWMLFGNATFQLDGSNPLHQAAARIDFKGERVPQTVALQRRLTNFDLTGTAGIEFDLAATTGTAVIASLGVRTPDGMRDCAASPVLVAGEPQHVKLPYEQFGSNRGIVIFPNAIVTISISAVLPRTAEGSFWIGDVRAFSEKK